MPSVTLSDGYWEETDNRGDLLHWQVNCLNVVISKRPLSLAAEEGIYREVGSDSTLVRE